jgi:hypothetical protein
MPNHDHTAWEADRDARLESDEQRVSWVDEYDSNNVRQLAHEVVAAVELAESGAGTWEEVGGVVHAWRESLSVPEEAKRCMAEMLANRSKSK